jgi:hypothetical protein
MLSSNVSVIEIYRKLTRVRTRNIPPLLKMDRGSLGDATATLLIVGRSFVCIEVQNEDIQEFERSHVGRKCMVLVIVWT